MTGFGANIPSAVEAGGKAMSPDPKKAANDDARKQSEQAKTGPPTPDSTPGPETERLEADKARQNAETAKASSNEESPDKDQAEKETAHSGSSEIPAGQEFSPKAQGREGPDTGYRPMERRSKVHLQIYKNANQYLGELMQNPKDAKVKSELNNLNKQIEEQDLKDKLDVNKGTTWLEWCLHSFAVLHQRKQKIDHQRQQAKSDYRYFKKVIGVGNGLVVSFQRQTNYIKGNYKLNSWFEYQTNELRNWHFN